MQRVEDNDSELPQIRIAAVDITALKRSEEALRRLSHFPDENPNPVLRSTPDGLMVYVKFARTALAGDVGLAGQGACCRLLCAWP